MATFVGVVTDKEHEEINQESQQIELALRMSVDDCESIKLSADESDGDEQFVIDVSYQPSSVGDTSADKFTHEDTLSYVISQDEGRSSAGVSYDRRSENDEELPCSLETCLALNRAYQQLIQENLFSIEVMLTKNQQRQKEVRYLIGGGRMKKLTPEQRRRTYWCEKSSYFRGAKTTDVPAVNDDVLAKRREREPVLWRNKQKRLTASEQRQLKEAVRKDGLQRLLTPVLNKKELIMEKLKRVSAEDVDALTTKLDLLEKEIIKIKESPSVEQIGSLEDAELVDWMRVSSVTFNGNHTPTELKFNWLNLYHPSISNKPWSTDEDDRLVSLVEQYGVHGKWEAVSRGMKTVRTVYQCFTRYQQTFNQGLIGNGDHWTKEESALLENIVEQVRNNEVVPWALVCTFMDGHTVNDCKKHYYKVLHPAKVGRWTAAEDERLIRIVKIFGDKAAWWRVAHYVGGGRSYYQCRDRYENQLRNHKKTGRPWSYEEDKFVYTTMNKQDFTGVWRDYARTQINRSHQELYHRSVRLHAWRQYCETLVGSHNALSLSAVTEPGQAKEVKDEWIRALLPPGVPMELANALFKPELDGTPTELDRDLRLIQADRMKGIFIPHPPSNLASLTKINYAARHRDFVTGVLQTVAQRAEEEKFGKQPETKKKSELILDHSILEKYLTSDKGANVSEDVKEKLRDALKNAETITMKSVLQLCAEMRTDILKHGKRRIPQSERLDDKLAAIIQARMNSRQTNCFRKGSEKGYSYHLRTLANANEDLTHFVDEDETLKRMANLLAQALEMNQETIVSYYDGREPPVDKRQHQLVDVFAQIQDDPDLQPELPVAHGNYRPTRDDENASDDGSVSTASGSRRTERVIASIWTGEGFPPEGCQAPLPPNHHTLFAFRNLLLDRRKLFKGAGKFINDCKTRSIWFNREYVDTKEYGDLLSRFVTLFTWPAVLSAMPVSVPEAKEIETDEPDKPPTNKRRKKDFPCATSFKSKLSRKKQMKTMAEAKRLKADSDSVDGGKRTGPTRNCTGGAVDSEDSEELGDFIGAGDAESETNACISGTDHVVRVEGDHVVVGVSGHVVGMDGDHVVGMDGDHVTNGDAFHHVNENDEVEEEVEVNMEFDIIE